MGVETKIEWTDATWNPWIGCAKISPGCEHCYAEADMDHRRHMAKWGVNGTRHVTSDVYWRQPLKWDREAREAIYRDFTLEQRQAGMHLASRPRVFCASLADVFEDRPELEAPRARLFDLIDRTPFLDWLLLTKRPENIGDLASEALGWDVPRLGMPHNVWLGTSVEDQERADERIPALLEIPAAVRFLGVEPLLGPIDLSRWLGYWDDSGELRPGVDWVIVGGESGRNARGCRLDWVRSIRDQCRAAGVPVFVKQLGAWPLDDQAPPGRLKMDLRDHKGGDEAEWPEDLRGCREFPAVAAAVPS